MWNLISALSDLSAVVCTNEEKQLLMRWHRPDSYLPITNRFWRGRQSECIIEHRPDLGFSSFGQNYTLFEVFCSFSLTIYPLNKFNSFEHDILDEIYSIKTSKHTILLIFVVYLTLIMRHAPERIELPHNCPFHVDFFRGRSCV